MSEISRAIARQNRVRAVELTRWAAGPLPEEVRGMDLPAGYRLVGLAKTPRGPFMASIQRPGQQAEVHRDILLVDWPGKVQRLGEQAWIDAGLRERCTICQRVVDSREVVAISLPGGAMGALCSYCQDRREERMVVTVDRDGYILDIEDEEG